MEVDRADAGEEGWLRDGQMALELVEARLDRLGRLGWLAVGGLDPWLGGLHLPSVPPVKCR